MFLRWLLRTFPAEMRRAWARVRPDLALWLALAALMAVAGTSLPGPMAPDAAQATPEQLRALARAVLAAWQDIQEEDHED